MDNLAYWAFACNETGESVADILATGGTTEESWFDFQKGKEAFLYSRASGTALGPSPTTLLFNGTYLELFKRG